LIKKIEKEEPKKEKILLPSSYPEPERKRIRIIPGRVLTARGFIQLLSDENSS